MSKGNHQITVINVKGSDKAVTATGEMFTSVIEALSNQFPKLKFQITTYTGSAITSPLLMVPTAQTKAAK